MLSENPEDIRLKRPDLNSAEAEAGTGKRSGVFNVYRMSKTGILVNLNADSPFEYRTLDRIASLAMRCGGTMETCNGDIAIFAFPQSGIAQFMEGIGFEIRIRKTVVSPKEKGISKVNIRFLER